MSIYQHSFYRFVTKKAPDKREPPFDIMKKRICFSTTYCIFATFLMHFDFKLAALFL